MIPFQVELATILRSFTPVRDVMQLAWSWPVVESIHFIGLTMLLGSIGAWDLRLLGVATQVPIAAFHRLMPFAVLGFAINASSGTFFLMTHPDQYVYNPAFHLKMLCVMLAGANVLVFYVTVFRRVSSLPPGAPEPVLAKLNGAVSLALWVTVIICGRMITFHRPSGCRPGEAIGPLAECIVRIVAITWTMDVQPGEFVEVALVARNPRDQKQIVWTLRQRFADGTVTDWTRTPQGAVRPTALTTLTPMQGTR